MRDVGSDWFRCSLTAVVGSLNNIRHYVYIVNTAGLSTFDATGSEGIWIANAQAVKFPFPKHYCQTTDTAIPASNWHTGSRLIVDGLDPGNIIKAGTRFEVVTRYHNESEDGTDTYEKTEFKRITEEVVVRDEGYAIIDFDPPLRNSPIPTRSWAQQAHLGETMHNAVIFANPEIKARLIGNSIKYTEKPLQMFDVEFEVIEDLTE